MNVLISGATGFVGSELLRTLSQSEAHVRGTSTSISNSSISKLLLSSPEWFNLLKGVDVFIHCAALAHVPAKQDSDFLKVAQEVNVEAPRRLARYARQQGVKRFIFLSSVKAMGEQSKVLPLCVGSEMQPEDLYGRTKRDAERVLHEELDNSGTELVIIRPPLVYGPGVKANFATLMKIAKRNPPLPFGSINNKRSLVALENLVDLIVSCVQYPESLNETFLVSDDHDVSTKNILETMVRAYGKSPKLWPFPVKLMSTAAALLGKKGVADRLFCNLQLDITYTKERLNWAPPVTFEDAINDCVAYDIALSSTTTS